MSSTALARIESVVSPKIATFGTLGAKAVVRDVGRALDVPYMKTDALAKLIPMQPGRNISLDDAIAEVPEFKEAIERDDEYLLIELTDSVFGTPVGIVERTEIRELPWCNQHAAGVHAEVPCQAFQRFGKSNDFFIFVIAFNCLFEFRHLGKTLVL